MAMIIKQFHDFFSNVFPVWILLAVTGLIDKTIGRIYSLLVVIIFIVLALIFLQHVILERNLLEEYKDKRSDENDRER